MNAILFLTNFIFLEVAFFISSLVILFILEDIENVFINFLYLLEIFIHNLFLYISPEFLASIILFIISLIILLIVYNLTSINEYINPFSNDFICVFSLKTVIILTILLIVVQFVFKDYKIAIALFVSTYLSFVVVIKNLRTWLEAFKRGVEPPVCNKGDEFFLSLSLKLTVQINQILENLKILFDKIKPDEKNRTNFNILYRIYFSSNCGRGGRV